MAAETIIVTQSDGTSDRSYAKVSQSAYSSRFAYTSNTASSRLFLDIDHKVAPIGNLASDVHTLTLRQEALDTDTQRVSVAKVSVQVTVPKGDGISVADIGDRISNVMCLFKTGFMEGFILGQTPSGDYNVTGPFNPVRA